MGNQEGGFTFCRETVIKMPICPECKSEIHSLDYNKEAVKSFRFTMDSKGNEDYDYYDEDSTFGGGSFCCPECCSFLFNKEEDAMNFLKEE